MKLTDIHPLPNAADKAALKVIAAHVVKACPSLHDTAHEVACDLLVKHGVIDLDPDQIWFHRFKSAQSQAASFTGWQHYNEKPYESLTLTQLVIHRFRATDQDNADLLDLYGGFYSAGPDEKNFDASNEVRLHGNEVLKDFWSINFSERYRTKLQKFWEDYSDEFRTLAKCNFFSKAVKARDSGQLTDRDFQTVVSAVIGPLTWPISLKSLQSETPVGAGLRVCALDIAGYVTTDILRIIDMQGRQILYVPGEAESFHVLETPLDMHWWALTKMNHEAPHGAFMNHFPLAERQAITENITDLMNHLVGSWGRADHHLINQKDLPVTGDAFSWLRDSTRSAMFAEAGLSLTSNGDLRKKLWIGYLSAGLKMFGPMAAVGWPVALPVIGASLANMGLNIDQAVNAKTASERKEGVIGAIFSAIDALFNLPYLKGAGAIEDVGAEVEAAETAELPHTPLNEQEPSILPEESETALLPTVEIPPLPPEAIQPPEIPQRYQANELLEGQTPASEPGKFQGIYRLDSDPPYAVLMNDTAYYVQYFPDSRGGGYWAIVDPARPNQFSHALPIRLNAEGRWERMAKLGLQAGGQCLGKECPVELEMEVRGGDGRPSPDIDEGVLQASEPQPATSAPPRLVTTSYDVEPHAGAGLKKWALGLREIHVQLELGPQGGLVIPDRYASNFAEKSRVLQLSARRFYQNLPWTNLPPRPPLPAVDATTTFSTLIERLFKVAPGLVVGETLDRITSMRLMIENMPSFAAEGVKTIYVRRLLSDFAQIDLNDYFQTGAMPEDLQAYLTRLGTDPAEQFNELELVKTARQNGIRVQATECAANYRKPTALLPLDEQMITNHLTSDIMFADRTLNPPGKWVVLTGPESTNTFRGLAGISELEGGIGLRIDEVNPGEGQDVAIDTGIDMASPIQDNGAIRGAVETLHADLHLQIEAPAVIRTAQQTARLLYRRGMYLFEKSEGVYTLVHRNQQDTIVRTVVESMADGHYRIDRPSWTSVSGIPFSSVEQLSAGLNKMGLSLQSRIPA
ncbi:membrane-targeted effector domain-containing toxin [Pseudomonas putida]|uniref:membrane-targeted effector domain-containing toxin n=1 Tax=Pseudomonas putida TaxID=303 RepID=UPI003D96AC76